MTVRITHIGGPTALLEMGEWRLPTDPTFAPPAPLGPPLHLRLGLQLPNADRPGDHPADPGPIDAVLLSHDHHGDNLDTAGRTLQPWATTQLEAPAKPPIQVTATPCRHGPPLSRLIVGEVKGFALA